MKKLLLAITMAALAAGVANAADVSASVDFASAYIFRGTTLNDGFVMQPGAEISGLPIPEKFGSIAIGTWANFDFGDYDGAVEENQFSEIDYYVNYSLPVSVVDLGIGYIEYTYPNGGDADREFNFSVGKELWTNGIYASVVANYGVDGAVEENWYIQAGLDYGIDLTDKLSLAAGATIAVAILDEGDDGFNDATLSLGASYALTENWALNGSVTYVAQLDDDVLTDEAYDRKGFASIGISCDF